MLSPRHRRLIHGKTITVDSDPANDYDDGFNAGRRMHQRKLPSIRIWWFTLGMLAEFLLLVVTERAL